MSELRIEKVNALPATLTANTLYVLNYSGKLIFYVTDSNGVVIYRTYDSTDISSIINLILATKIGQPNGIAGLDANGNVLGNIIANAIDAQEADFRSDNDYVWLDLKSPIEVRPNAGVNNPNWGTWRGNFQGYLFSGTTMNQFWADFHIDHDIALNTKIYPHIHWLATTTNLGTVRWGFEYCIAKGHDQELFNNPVTVYVEQTLTAGMQYMHRVAEVSDTDAILSSSIEPDTFIKFRCFRDAANDTHNDVVHAWQIDLHYQKARIGTRNKSPNFYAP